MRRRDFIKAVAVVATASPLAARAQQSALPVVGFVNAEAANSEYGSMAVLFRDGLGEAGFIDGKNVTVENHWADSHYERLPAMLSELARRHVAVIVATTTPAALAAKATVTTVPVVFETGGDPIGHGLVSSLSHPGGNITGVSQSNQEVAPKRLELLHETLPQAKVIALLVNSRDPALAANIVTLLRAAAQDLGVELGIFEVQSEGDFDKAFAGAVKMGATGLIIGDDPFLTSHTQELGALAARYGIAAIYKGREFVKAGGVMSYGTVVGDTYRLAGVYAGRILKGDKPGDLPVQRASKVELFINLKSAKALGVKIPLPLSGRADEVIE